MRGYDASTRHKFEITFFGSENYHREKYCCTKMAGSLLWFWFSSESINPQLV
jgi:hypothetical protein